MKNTQKTFKGLKTDTLKWVYGDLFHADSGLTIIENGGAKQSNYHFVSVAFPFIGAHSWDGKKIFDGQVVKNTKSGSEYVVEYCEQSCGFILRDINNNKITEFSRLACMVCDEGVFFTDIEIIAHHLGDNTIKF